MLALFFGLDASLLDSVPACGLVAYFEQAGIVHPAEVTLIDGALLFVRFLA